MDHSLPPDPYLALGVTKDATIASIKTAYRKLVLKHHPDKVQEEDQKAAAVDRFHKIQVAYEIIGDEDRRARYDAQVKLSELRKEVLEKRPSQKSSVPAGTYRSWDAASEERHTRGECKEAGVKDDFWFNTSRSRADDRYEERAASRKLSREYSPRSERSRGRADDYYQPPAQERSNTRSRRDSAEGREYRGTRPEISGKGGSHASARPNSQPLQRPNRLDPTRASSSTTVYYDLHLEGKLNGSSVKTFPDQGAGHNFLAQDYVSRKGIKVDSSETITVFTANKKPIQTLGRAKLPFCFKGDTEEHLLDFHVLPKCISNIVLGDNFLKATSAFTRFAHCIQRTLRSILPFRVCYLGGQQTRLGGWLDGRFVGALPDTGCDLMLMSRSYALKRGFKIDNDPAHRHRLQMGDLSTAYTSGYVSGVEWTFGNQDGEEFGHTHDCSFWILDDLACDVILSDEFLVRTRALEDMMHCEYETATEWSTFGAIKVVGLRRSKKAQAEPTSYDEWLKKVQKERLYQNDVEGDMGRLPVDAQDRMRDELKRRWDELQALRPTPPPPPTSLQPGTNSPSSSKTARPPDRQRHVDAQMSHSNLNPGPYRGPEWPAGATGPARTGLSQHTLQHTGQVGV